MAPLWSCPTCPGGHAREPGRGEETRRLTRLRHLSVEALQNGQLLLGRSGTIRGFGASLNLLPEHNDGHFFSFDAEYYRTSACQIVPEFREQLLERFLC